MDKQIELSKIQKSEDKILIAKTLDKVNLVQNRNRLAITDFLDLREQSLLKNTFTKIRYNDYQFFGGYEQSERKIVLLFPNNINICQINGNLYNKFLSVIRIQLPNDLKGMYEHRNYLGGLMKLGIKREKIGDIIVRNDGADIIIIKDLEKYIIEHLKDLIRFKKAIVESKNIEEMLYTEPKKESIKINVPSMRLDCIVGELARCSRNDANIYLKEERVFVNFIEEIRPSKNVNEGDYITIRGKGRFRINKILGQTKSGRLSIEVEK